MNKLVRRSQLFVKRNSATILTWVGAAGVVGTAVLAAKATPKAYNLMEAAKEEKGEDLTKLEMVKIAGPAYIPALAVGAGTIACIFGANILNKRQQAALMSAYALLDGSYKDYKKKVEEMLGEDGAREITTEIAKDKYKETDISVSDDEELFYDEYSRRYFTSTKYDVQHAEYQLNRDIQMQGYACLNDFYEYLDIDPIDGGDLIGWSEGGNLAMYWQSWVDFNHHKVVMDDGLECCIVSFFEEPIRDFDTFA